jgi:transketolase
MSSCLRETQVEVYTRLVEAGLNMIYLVSDSVSTSKIKPFKDAYPERVINVGIAEQNLLGIAAGLANGGFVPVTGNATPFLISRSNEQLKVDVSYTNSNVKVNGLHAGFSYGTDGCTHHEVNDVSVVRGLPNFEIYVPCDPRECAMITEYALVERRGPVYMSLNTGNFPNITAEGYRFVPGKPVQLSEGRDITVVALGTAVHDAAEALRSLGSACSADVFALSSVRPLDPSALIASIRKTGLVLTVEQHSTHGGAGSLVAECIADNGLGARLKRLGVPEGVYTKNWSAPDNKRYFGLDSGGIKETLLGLLGSRR